MVRLEWVPGHEGHRDNEVADRLAKLATVDQGAMERGEAIDIPISISEARRGITKWGRDQHINKWRDSDHAKTLHKIFEGRELREVKQLINWPRRDIRLFINTLTGQTGLKKLLFAANKIETPICECGAAVEGNLHYLTECERYARIRYDTFKTDILNDEDLKNIRLIDIVRYIRRTGRFSPEETWRIAANHAEGDNLNPDA